MGRGYDNTEKKRSTKKAIDRTGLEEQTIKVVTYNHEYRF